MTGTCLPPEGLSASGSLDRSSGYDSSWCDVGAGDVAFRIPLVETTHSPESNDGCTVYFHDSPPLSFPIRGDGHSFFIQTPNLNGELTSNQYITLEIDNIGSTDQFAKINCHINRPKGITGIGGRWWSNCRIVFFLKSISYQIVRKIAFLRDLDGNLLGNHVQYVSAS